MSRFENFYEDALLVEKVSKKDIAEALKNPNILVGAEFEFIMNAFDITPNDAYNDAKADYDIFMKELKKAQKEYDLAQKEWKKLYDKVSKLEMEIIDLEEEMEDAFSDAKKRKITAAIKVKKDNLKDANYDYTYHEEHYINEIDWPLMGTDYYDYMDIMAEEAPDIDPFAIVTGEQEPPDAPPEDNVVSSDPDAIERHMEQTGMFRDAPFKNYKIGSYGTISQKVGDKHWAIENDASLDEGGVEIKSPPMPLPEFMKILPKMFKWIDKHGHTESDTGFHVHMSIKGVNDLSKSLNKLKMLLFFDEGFIWNAFDERMNNTFVRSVKDKLKSKGTISLKDANKIFSDSKMSLKLASIHDDAINFQGIKQGHIEYRYMGGTDYHKKLSQVEATIGHYSHNLSVGYDDEFKKKEYAHKLARILNKMELYRYRKWVGWILDVPKKAFDAMPDSDKKLVTKRKKEWRKKQYDLEKIYKLDGETIRLLNKNTKYLQSLWDDYKKEMGNGLTRIGKVNMKTN